MKNFLCPYFPADFRWSLSIFQSLRPQNMCCPFQTVTKPINCSSWCRRLCSCRWSSISNRVQALNSAKQSFGGSLATANWLSGSGQSFPLAKSWWFTVDDKCANLQVLSTSLSNREPAITTYLQVQQNLIEFMLLLCWDVDYLSLELFCP